VRVPPPGVVLVLAVGCAPSSADLTPLLAAGQADSAEYAPFVGDSSLELRGQAFLTTRAGEVKLAAGQLVTLDPVTTYSRRWFRGLGVDLARFAVPPPDPRFANARRTRNADTEGKFHFTRLRPGAYLVRSSVIWLAAAPDSGQEGGVVAAVVTVREGNDESVILSRPYPADSAAVFGIEIVSDSSLSTRKHRVLARISGGSCETASELPARRDLIHQAARKRADAVAHVACRKRGLSLSRGCLTRIECSGDAIAWP